MTANEAWVPLSDEQKELNREGIRKARDAIRDHLAELPPDEPEELF